MNGINVYYDFNIFDHLLINLNPNVMVKRYFFLLFISATLVAYSQSPCDQANSDLIYAYSNVKSSYNSNNVSHLKYYANRSLESFERSKKSLTNCGCEKAYDLAHESIEMLKKVETAESFEDGRFFVKRVREMAQKSVTELDKCTIPSADNQDNQELSSLQIEQAKLKKQQEELKLKAEEIKAKLAAQEEMEQKLKKEELINSYKTVIATNLETYNNALKVCDCDKEVQTKLETDEGMSTKSMEEIKQYFIKSLKGLTSNYLTQLDLCSE